MVAQIHPDNGHQYIANGGDEPRRVDMHDLVVWMIDP